MWLNRSSLEIAGGVIIGEVWANILSNVHVTGGVIGDQRYSFRIWNRSSLTVSAGSLQSYVELDKASLRVTGGQVRDVTLLENSNALMTGGEIGLLKIGSGVARIDGGVVGAVHNFDELDIFGGSISSYIWAHSASRLRIHGSQFSIDGVDVTSQIVFGEPFVISQRNVTLTGKYRDGTHFELPFSDARSFLDPTAVVFLHLVPEPCGEALGMIALVASLAAPAVANNPAACPRRDASETTPLRYHAFRFGCEVTAHALQGRLGLIEDGRILETLQAVADGEETLLESPTDTTAWYQQQLQEREQIIARFGEAFFENIRRHGESASEHNFSADRAQEIALAKAVLDSLHDGKFKPWEPPAPPAADADADEAS